MNGMLFKSLKGDPYYYSPHTGRIVKLPYDFSEEQLKPEDIFFRFGYDKDKIRSKLNNDLEIIILEGSQNCNLRCNYCIFGGDYKGEREHKPFEMDFEVARKSVAYFLEHSKNTRPLRAVSFYGGESLLNFSLVKSIVDEFKDSPRTFFSVSTNGLLINKYFEDIISRGINLAVSLDGDRSIHDKNRLTIGGKPSFDLIMKGIDKLGESYVRKKLSFSATITDEEDFIKSYRFFRDNFRKNPTRLEFVKSDDRLSNTDKRLKIPKDAFAEMLSDYESGIVKGNMPEVLKFIFDDTFLRIHCRMEEYKGEELRHSRTCVPGTRKLFVDASGNFYTCEKLGYEHFNIGNVNSGIDEDRVFKLMDEITKTTNDDCSSCAATPLCNVCIPVSSLKCGNVSSERLKERCIERVKSIEKYLGLYADLNERLGDKFQDYLTFNLKGGVK